MDDIFPDTIAMCASDESSGNPWTYQCGICGSSFDTQSDADSCAASHENDDSDSDDTDPER